MFSVHVLVELDVTVNYIQILTVAQLCFYGKFKSPAAMEIIDVSFWKKLHTKQFALPPHVTYTGCTTTNDSMLMPFFRPSLAKPTVNKSCSYSFFLSVTAKHCTRTDGINQLRSTSVKCYDCVSVLLP
jgi:ribosomal protein S27E